MNKTPERQDDATAGARPDPSLPVPANAAGGFIARLGGFFAVLFVLIGIHTPFFPVWLAAKGLDAREIGIVLAAPMFVRFVAVPLVTRWADRNDSLRGTLIAVCWATLFGYFAIAATGGFWGILLAVVLMAAGNAPVMALADAYALQGLKGTRRAYGPVRMWGSVAFIAANLGAGWMLDWIAPAHLIWLMLAAAFVIALWSLLLTPLSARAAPAGEAASVFGLLLQPAFLCVALGASLIQASHSLYYGFSAIAWRAANYDGLAIGALWALGVIAEILLFAISGRLPPAFGPLLLLALGGAGAALRWIAMAFDPPGWSLPLLQCLHGLSFGATHLGTIAFLAAAAPAYAAATVQGYFYVVLSLVMAAAMSVTGFLYGAYGAAGYAAMALAALLGFALALLARRFSAPTV